MRTVVGIGLSAVEGYSRQFPYENGGSAGEFREKLKRKAYKEVSSFASLLDAERQKHAR